jgi:hypothetical protein
MLVFSAVDALKPIKHLLETLQGGPGLPALELADSVSGGHMKKAAKTSDELFSSEIDIDTREAALMGLDLARLNDARFRVVLELIQKIIDVEDELAKRWADRPVEERPELRDLQAGAALVAKGYAQQQSHQRRRIIVDALRGSFCPEPYLWGFQDELLRGLIDSRLTESDINVLRSMSPPQQDILEGDGLLTSPKMESYERLANAELVVMRTSENVVRSRLEIGRSSKVLVYRTHKGGKLLIMLDAGRQLRERNS